MTDLSNEAMLIQLGYAVSDQSLAQAQRIRENTASFDHLSKHIIALNDHLKHMHAFVAMSNSSDYYKIKNEAPSDALREEAEEEIKKWAQKYKVALEKVY